MRDAADAGIVRDARSYVRYRELRNKTSTPTTLTGRRKPSRWFTNSCVTCVFSSRNFGSATVQHILHVRELPADRRDRVRGAEPQEDGIVARVAPLRSCGCLQRNRLRTCGVGVETTQRTAIPSHYRHRIGTDLGLGSIRRSRRRHLRESSSPSHGSWRRSGRWRPRSATGWRPLTKNRKISHACAIHYCPGSFPVNCVSARCTHRCVAREPQWRSVVVERERTILGEHHWKRARPASGPSRLPSSERDASS